MRIIKSKKAISDVVGVTVITMLTIGALSLVWAYVSDLGGTLNSQLSPVSDCLQLNTRVTEACYNQQTQQIELTAVSSPGNILNSVTFVASDGQNSQSYVCGSSSQFACLTSCIPPTDGEAKKIFLPSSAQPSELIYYPNNCDRFSRTVSQIPSCS